MDGQTDVFTDVYLCVSVERTNERTSRKQYAPHFFKVGGIKSGKTVFQIITRSVAMETSGWIWPNFELIQAFMHVLIACNNEKDQMKNGGENVVTKFSPLQVGFFQTLKGSQLCSPWSDLAEFRTHSSSYVYHRYLQV